MLPMAKQNISNFNHTCAFKDGEGSLHIEIEGEAWKYWMWK